MVEKELLNGFYRELMELLGEEAMLKFYDYYQGLVISVPKKLYSGEKLAEKLADFDTMDLQAKQLFARKYGYSQRQIDRLLKKNREKKDD